MRLLEDNCRRASARGRPPAPDRGRLLTVLTLDGRPVELRLLPEHTTTGPGPRVTVGRPGRRPAFTLRRQDLQLLLAGLLEADAQRAQAEADWRRACAAFWTSYYRRTG